LVAELLNSHCNVSPSSRIFILSMCFPKCRLYVHNLPVNAVRYIASLFELKGLATLVTVTGFVSAVSIKQDYTDIITDNFDWRGTVMPECRGV
jgi:hypothetical protein